MKRVHDISIGAMVNGRKIVGISGDSLALRCACGRDSVVKRNTIYTANGRCRACGYADMPLGHREPSGGGTFYSDRTMICRLAVEHFGPADSDARGIEDGIVSVVLDLFEKHDLGGMPFTSAETGILLGLSKAGVGVVEARALRKMRQGLRRVAGDVVEALRERDADRNPWPRQEMA